MTLADLNLDAMPVEAVEEFCHTAGYGVRPIALATQLFPDRPKGYVRATKDIRNYAWNKLTAMWGDIVERGNYE